MVMQSASLSYAMVCMPGTSPRRTESMAQLVVGAVGRAFYMAVGSRQSALHPAVLAVEIVYYLLGKSYRRAARSVELMHVVSLLHCNRILRKSVHYLCQIAVYGREYGHAYTEVRGPEKGLSALGAHLSDIVAVVFHPSRRARHHLYVVRKGPDDSCRRRQRIGELDGNISRGKGLAVEVLLIVDVDYTYNWWPRPRAICSIILPILP